MGWFDDLIEGLRASRREEEEEEESRRESETVRKIARKLEALPRSRARFVASFAYVLGRVAYADHDVSDEETRAMEELVREEVELPRTRRPSSSRSPRPRTGSSEAPRTSW